MEINQLIQKELQTIETDKMFREELEKQVRETVRKVMKDQLGTWSPLSKALEEYLKENVKIDFSKVSVPQYTEFVVQNCFEVVKELMSAERAESIRKHFRDKLAPNLVQEIEFNDLIDAIRSSLIESLRAESKDDPCCAQDTQHHIVCELDEKTYGNYWTLKIYEGERRNNSDELAVLCMDGNGKCYHSRGKKNEEFARRFASYVFNNTLVLNVEECNITIDVNDLI